MYYTFFKQTKQIQQKDFLNLDINNTDNAYKSITLNIKTPISSLLLKTKQNKYIQNTATAIQTCYMHLFPFKNTYMNEYYKFFIPKRNHKLREINAPNNDFKEALTIVKDIFQNTIKCLPHSAAHAYVPTLSTSSALEKHQKNNSRWFLKMDLKDFFPSCTPQLVYNKLIQLFPFYYLKQNEKELLKEIIQITSLNNGMPQGSPFSPYITNLVMVDIDYKITKLLSEYPQEHFTYTRYADDLLISSPISFCWSEIQDKIKKILEPHFQINTEKTRYGSNAGSNWNLGLMLNKDNNITLGHIKKRNLNAMLNNFFTAYQNGEPWCVSDTQVLQGQLSYLAHIEEAYYNYIIKKYEKKFKLNYHNVLSEILNPIKL